MPQKRSRHSMQTTFFGVEGCPLRRGLQQGLGMSAEQNRGLGGDIRLKSGPYLVLFVLLHGGRPGSGRQSTTLANILPQERYQLVSDLYLQCLPCATQMHTWRYGSLPAPSSPGGHRLQEVFEGFTGGHFGTCGTPG